MVGGGTVVREGDLPAGARDRVEQRAWETHVVDAFGNTVRVGAGEGGKKKLSNKERKVREKLKKARRERGEAVSSSSEDEDEA